MEWLIPRILASLFWVLVGGAVGMFLGERYAHAALGALLGAGFGVFVHSIVDAVRAERLVQWLRGKQVNNAPRGGEFWGEVADFVSVCHQNQFGLKLFDDLFERR